MVVFFKSFMSHEMGQDIAWSLWRGALAERLEDTFWSAKRIMERDLMDKWFVIRMEFRATTEKKILNGEHSPKIYKTLLDMEQQQKEVKTDTRN